jgi:hypothetical protein
MGVRARSNGSSVAHDPQGLEEALDVAVSESTVEAHRVVLTHGFCMEAFTARRRTLRSAP